MLLALAAAPVAAQPVVESVSNRFVQRYEPSTYFRFSDRPASTAVAPGSIFMLYGTRLGPDFEAIDASAFPLQEQLAGTEVEITTDSGVVHRALPLSVALFYVIAVLPSEVPVGEHSVAVRRDGAVSEPYRFKVVRTSIGIATSFFAPYPQAIEPSPDAPLRPGETFSLWATGLGPIEASDALPAPLGDLPVNLEVWIGDRPAEIEYQGRSPCCAGLDQIQVRVPEDAPTGCHIPVWTAVNEAEFSDVVTIPTSRDGGDCRLERGAVRQAYAAGPAGRFTLTRFVDGEEIVDSAAAEFQSAAVRSIWQSAPHSWTGLDPSVWPAPGTCLPEETRFLVRPSDLDGGDLFTLEGPSGVFALSLSEGLYPGPIPGATSILRPLVESELDSDPPLNLVDGDYVLTSAGGPEFPAFSAEVSMESREWRIDEEALGLGRLGAEWSSGSGSETLLTAPIDCRPRGGVATCLLGGQIPGQPQLSGGFACRAPASATSFEVPEVFAAKLGSARRLLRLTAVGGPVPMQFETDGPETGLVTALHSTGFPLELGPPHLPSTPVFLPDGTQIQAELATNPAEHQRGLMFRPEVPRGRGMLFLFARPGFQRFWMRNTITPLDMIFLDADRNIVLIAPDRQPCLDAGPCPLTGPDTPTQFVLELAAGEAARLGLNEGDHLDW